MPWVQACGEGFCEVSGAEFRDSWKSQPSETCAAMGRRSFAKVGFLAKMAMSGRRNLNTERPCMLSIRQLNLNLKPSLAPFVKLRSTSIVVGLVGAGQALYALI